MRKTASKVDFENMTAEQIVALYGKDELAEMTFAEIEAKYGEEVAICAGIVADPDTRELTKEDFARMRPATEVAPHIVEGYRRTRGQQESTHQRSHFHLSRRGYHSSFPGYREGLADAA